MRNSEAISRILETLGKGREVWLTELARKSKVPAGSIRYYIFGQKKEGREYGGYLKDRIATKTEGRNVIVRLRK